MTRLGRLISELDAECATTRRHLERLEDAHFGWRPHDRSFTAGALASHLVGCVEWTESIFGGDELEMDPAEFRPFRAEEREELLAGFDRTVAAAMRAMEACPDEDADDPWELRMGGKVWFRKAREDVFRDMTLSHLIHHRGQLTVYLRLLDVPVPSTYGPTADENPFGSS